VKTPSVILLVEDREDDLFFMRRALKQSGVRNPLHVVSDGAKAIEYLSGLGDFADREEHPLPDLVILDLKMPGKDGFEVLAWIRQSHLPHIPVAVLAPRICHPHRHLQLS
jgi:CheY-like chemotaxis protein